MNNNQRMGDIFNREKETVRHSFDAEAQEEISDRKGEISNQSESKLSVDCSVQAGSPAVKMVRFTVETDRQSDPDRKYSNKPGWQNHEYKFSSTRATSASRESMVVGGVAATIFILCCLTIGVTTNISKDVDRLHWMNQSGLLPYPTHSSGTSNTNTLPQPGGNWTKQQDKN
eukprot:TRINITY_DN15661_c0_g1_i1.p1 TRINITY_DN15661_c0_g1~~TRINITY_DN15661_c0_g1_i1.p1  ORF type:complete len:172 (-),score=55.01 TRINITY_DN15661_c0_g1_i1:150-665(-)